METQRSVRIVIVPAPATRRAGLRLWANRADALALSNVSRPRCRAQVLLGRALRLFMLSVSLQMLGSGGYVAGAWVGSASSMSLDTRALSSPYAAPTVGCTVEGRPPGDFMAAMATPGGVTALLLGTPVATPAPPRDTIPADDDVVAALTATMEELAACINAGDLPRAAALFTDYYFFWFFGGISQSNFNQLATPVPLAPDQQIESVSVEDVAMLADGRVSAVTQVNEARALTVFARVGDRYLIDFNYDLREAATPQP